MGVTRKKIMGVEERIKGLNNVEEGHKVMYYGQSID